MSPDVQINGEKIENNSILIEEQDGFLAVYHPESDTRLLVDQDTNLSDLWDAFDSNIDTSQFWQDDGTGTAELLSGYDGIDPRQIQGDVDFNNNSITDVQSVETDDGSNTSPSVGFTNEDGLGIYRPSSGVVGVAGGNLRLATGQFVEDGSGTNRLAVANGSTTIYDEGGRVAFTTRNTDDTQIRTYSNQPYTIQDQEGGFTAVQYDTDASAGLLRTPNAGLRVESDKNPSSGAGLLFRYDGTAGIIYTRDDGGGSYEETEIRGDGLKLTSFSGLIDASQQSANLRLATGQSIEDGSGGLRLEIANGYTRIYDGGGRSPFEAVNGGTNTIKTYSDQGFRILDKEGSFTAIQYITSSTSSGTLELTNAMLNYTTGSDTNDSMTANPESDAESGYIEVELNGSTKQIPVYDP